MDRRKYQNQFNRLGLKPLTTTTTTGKNDELSGSSGSEILRKTSASSSFRPVLPSGNSKRKELADNDNNSSQLSIMLSSAAAKKKRSDPSQENLGNHELSLRNRPPSSLSDTCSQSSSKTSVMSKFMSMSKKNPEKPITSFSNFASIISEDRSQVCPKTPVKIASQKPTVSSVSPNTSEFERQLAKSDEEISPLRPIEPVIEESNNSARKRLARELVTPSKSGGSESDKSMFSSGSSSAKKRGRLSLGSPHEKNNKDNEANSVKRRLLDDDDDDDIIIPMKGDIFSSTRNEEVNKVSSLFSPERPTRNESEFLQPGPVQSKNKFIAFLNDARVTLVKGDSPHQINGDPNDIKANMRKLLEKGYKTEEISADWKNFIDVDNNLKKATQDLKVVDDGQPFPSWYNTSLIKLLLQIAEIQKPFLFHLLSRLNEVVLEANDAESVPWAFTILQQIRFLEFIVNPESLTEQIEILIEHTPMWFQKELIVFLPDIVIDTQHHAISEILLKLMETYPELINVILDTLSTFSFGKMQFEELRSKLIDMLETTDPCNVPAISRFILRNCNEERPAEEFFRTLRLVHLEPLPNTKLEECYANQIAVVQIISQAMKAFKKVVNATANVLKTIVKANSMDIIYLLSFFASRDSNHKIADAYLKRNIRNGNFRLSLFQTFYREYIEAARELQSSALESASNLVKSNDQLYTELGIEWFVLIFMSQNEIYKQRQVLDKILQLVGYDNSTANKAFTILSKMIADDDRRKQLHSHCNTLKILLEKVDNLDLESVAILNDVLHGLCIQSSSISETLYDDMTILMSKQIASSKPITKCKGVLSACMAIKHLASKEEKYKDALDLFEKVKLGVNLCLRSQALFYDRMSMIVAETENIDHRFLQHIWERFEEAFVQYIDFHPSQKNDMKVEYGLNPLIENEREIILYFGEGKFGGIVPILFRLLRMCNARLSQNIDNLEDINALLGAPILVPINLKEPEARNLDYMLYCINWFREVISGFVKDSDSRMQRRVLKRLDDLMKLQGDFQMALSMIDFHYEPPQAYFHYFPVKPFVKIEKKTSKKGKKGAADKSHMLTNPDWETFDLGSLLVSKNPTYFRKLDIKVVHLLNLKMGMALTQTSNEAVSIAQVCFVVKEFLGMLENNDSELLIRDLINLLPEICNKLQDIANEVKENEIDDCQMREALVLLLQLVNQIFSWKELYNSAKYEGLLKEGLSTIAMKTRGMNLTQVSMKDLVAEAYRFFEQMCNIAEGRSIILACSIVNICGTIMKHAKVFENENKEAHATMAYDFLRSKNWLDKQSGSLYRNAVAGLLKTWIDNEPSPLNKVAELVEWVRDDVEVLEKASDCLRNLSSINKSNFPLLFKKILEGLIKGIKNDLRSFKTNEPCTSKLATWLTAGKTISKIVDISKTMNTKTIHILSVRYLIIIVRLVLNHGIVLMEHNLKYRPQEVINIINYFQKSTRYLHNIYCTGINEQDTTMTKYFPSIKSLYDQLLCRIKGLMAFNNSLDYFKLGNLTKKDIHGQVIQSQSSVDESSGVADAEGVTDGTESNLSEILGDEGLPDINSESSDDEMNEEDNDVDDNTNDSI